MPNKPYGFCGRKAPRKKKIHKYIEAAILNVSAFHNSYYLVEESERKRFSPFQSPDLRHKVFVK